MRVGFFRVFEFREFLHRFLQDLRQRAGRDMRNCPPKAVELRELWRFLHDDLRLEIAVLIISQLQLDTNTATFGMLTPSALSRLRYHTANDV